MPTTAEKLWAAAQALPEPLLAEVLDFAEFVRLKHQNRQEIAFSGTTTLAAPLTLVDLQGGLEASTTFAGDALQLQRQLRDEWR